MRLRRVGTKGRPFYRVVVAPSSGGRNGRFVEVLGTYDPVSKPVAIKINEERALHWLMQGAQPTETTAVVLNKAGVLDKFFAQRPTAKGDYKFLDKTTGLTSKVSAVTTTAPAAPAAVAEKPSEAPVEAPAETPSEAPSEAPEPEIAAPAEPEPAAEPVSDAGGGEESNS
jgi:small subunit ribosomal protein S16